MKQNIIGVSSFSFLLLTWNNFNLEKVERLFFTFIVLERSSKETSWNYVFDDIRI